MDRRRTQGDWKGIATEFVVSRTPSQVASHAQKYFLRQNTKKDDRERKSIHDITTGESDQTSVSLPRFNKKNIIQLLIWMITLLLHRIDFLLFAFVCIGNMNCNEYRSNHMQKCYRITLPTIFLIKAEFWQFNINPFN
ncbi:hypothetical protein TanjilG_19291 [Lupinus angustifolius]|uniref:HTH myb-type domain-containing protein n=1 Tax=Lupinus angustifolius TaxID=3871 RepID=A0A1J7HYL8_LUPAN|nr:hypothetical protein TanjilG_19291 [Lupinus angustifolius]